MSKHTVESLIKSSISYDRSWGIYATSCEANAEARLGQTQFPQGGLLDGKQLICDGQQLGDALQRWGDGEEIDMDDLDVDFFLQEEICE